VRKRGEGENGVAAELEGRNKAPVHFNQGKKEVNVSGRILEVTLQGQKRAPHPERLSQA